MKPIVSFRTHPQDFVVEELPAYEPTGQGEHLFVKIRKTGLTTIDCVHRLARALEVDGRDIGYAGMKDRHAVTTQTLSVPFASAKDPAQVLGLQLEGIEVLSAVRHPHKIRIGHLVGNRFQIVLRKVPQESVQQIVQALEEASRCGVPNAYGPQRFGRDGNNAERTLSWLRGESKGPRDVRQKRLLFSSVQAMLFDRVLEQREKDGTWKTVLLGDVVKKHDTGGLFVCEQPEVDALRAERLEVSATGPIFGAKMRWPEASVAELERQVLRETLGDELLLDKHGKLGAGSRRVLRVVPEELSTKVETDREAVGTEALEVSFVLPKGAYATTVLLRACQLHDESRRFDEASKATDSSGRDELFNDTESSSE